MSLLCLQSVSCFTIYCMILLSVLNVFNCTFSSFLSLNENSIFACFLLFCFCFCFVVFLLFFFCFFFTLYCIVFVLVSLTWYLSLPANDHWIFLKWHCSFCVSAINSKSSATPTTPRYIEPICSPTSCFVTQSNNGFKKCLYPVGDHTPPWRTPWHSGNGNDISPSPLKKTVGQYTNYLKSSTSDHLIQRCITLPTSNHAKLHQMLY